MTTRDWSYRDLTDLQLELLEALWSRNEATVGEVQATLASERALAATTVATLLSRLERRGIITHRVDGRQFVYRPLITREEVRSSMVAALTDRLFSGDITALVSHLLRQGEISEGDLDHVQRLIDARTNQAEGV